MSDVPVFRINLVRDPNNIHAQLYIQDVYELVEEEMEVSYEDVIGVQRRGFQSFDIMIKKEEYAKYSDIINDFMNKRIQLSNGKIVTVIDAYEKLTYVVVRGFPMHWEIEKMHRIMSYYGEIRQVINERYSAKDALGTRYKGKWNGNIRYKMRLRSRIPCGLTVGDERLQIFYPEQEQACRKCDLGDHKWFNCRTPFRERKNIFNMEDFPELDEDLLSGRAHRSRVAEESKNKNENENENENENKNKNENQKENKKDTDMNNEEGNTEKEDDQADKDIYYPFRAPTSDMEQDLETRVIPGEINEDKEKSEENDIENQNEIHLATPTEEMDSHEMQKTATETEYEELQLIEKTQEINLKDKVNDSDELGSTEKASFTIVANVHHRDISQVLNKSNSLESDEDNRVQRGQTGCQGQMDLNIQKSEMNLDIEHMLTMETDINTDIDPQIITPGQKITIDEEKNTPEDISITKKKKREASSEDENSDSFYGFVGPLNLKEDSKNTEGTEMNSKEKYDERDKKKIRKDESEIFN